MRSPEGYFGAYFPRYTVAKEMKTKIHSSEHKTLRHEGTYIILFLTRHSESINDDKQEIAVNYEKYIRARDPFPWRSIHQNLNSLGNSLCSDSNLAGASLCRYNFCTWQVWHETHLPVYRYTVKACAKFVLMTRKWNTTKWNFNHARMCITVMS